MRLIKMLGLAAIAAMAAMAFVGASSASANATSIVLCQNAELVCETPFANPTTIVAHATEPKLLTSLGTVVCEKSLTETTLLNTLSTLGVGHILALSFENCKLGKTACTVTLESLGLLSFVKTGALTGTAKSTGGTVARVKCGSLLDCKYGGEPTLVVESSAGGETKLVASETTILNEIGEKFICPDTSKWDAVYTALGAMWIES